MPPTGVVYSNGRVVSLHAYGQMAARTGVSNALQVGRDDRYRQMGVRLGKITSIGTLCERCRPWEGCIVAMDAAGEARGYAPVARWYAVRHPNCQHNLTPWYAGFSGPAKHPPAWTAGADGSDYYRHFRDEHPELLKLQGRGFANEAQARRLIADGVARGEEADQVKGPRFREAGIEARRVEATKRVLTGQAPDYRTAMSQVTGERMHQERRGLFADTHRFPVTDISSATAVAKSLGVKAKYDNLTVANLTNQALREAKARGLEMPSHVVDDPAWFVANYSTPKNYPAAAWADTIRLNSSASYWSDSTLVSKEQFSIHNWSSGHQLHPLFHEIIHVNHYLQNLTEDLPALWNHRFTDEEDEIIRREVSRRATVSGAEYVAEVGAGLLSGRKFSATIMKLYDALGGPKV